MSGSTPTPLYFDDQYRTSADTDIAVSGSDDRGFYAVLATPLFYPQGGGQKGDRGSLRLDDGTAVGILDTRIADGEVRHYLDAPLTEGHHSVHQELNWPYRYHQMKMHSAAHFLHCALEKVTGAELPYPVRAPLSETGGECHYEFTDRFTEDQLAEAVRLMNAYTAEGHVITTHAEEDQGPGRRSWRCEDYYVPCGGLHPRESAEIGEIDASMRVKRGKTLVSFGPRQSHG